MKPPKYLEAIQAAMNSGIHLTGNLLLVERPPKEEMKTASGIIIADATKTNVNAMAKDAPTFVHILACGEGYYDEDGTSVPLDSKPGDVALVGEHSVQWFSQFPGILLKGANETQIGIVKESEIQLRFRGYGGYVGFCSTLQKEIAQRGETKEGGSQ